MKSHCLEALPVELSLQILSYLSPHDVAALMGTSRRLRTICREDGFWKSLCFDSSRLAITLRKRNWRPKSAGPQTFKERRTKIRAAWNAIFEPNERATWYDEYIHRHAPVVTNWFELPRRSDCGRKLDNANVLEVCGVALYYPARADAVADREAQTDDEEDLDESSSRLCGIPPLLAVAPLEDGSVCLWDVNGTVKRRGAIVQQSAPGLLFAEAQDPRDSAPQCTEISVTECVAVDSSQHLAFFAVGKQVVEIDLQRLAVVGVKTYAEVVSALSAAAPSVPLSVGTASEIHLYDVRSRTRSALGTLGLDSVVDMAARSTKGAPFPTPGPLSIVHVQEYGSEDVISNDIFAAGRIPSILHYDRRKLPVVKTAIHSGASLSSLASLPYPFPALKDYSHLCDGPARTSQATWRTVVACGEYKSKGSLELYPIDEGDGSSPMVNRQTSSSAKIFSVVSHGRQLALSDGAGCIRWFERDGFTEVRRCHLGSDDYADEGDKEEEDERRMAAEALGRRPDHTDSRRNGHLDSETGDIARKLLVTKAGSIGGAGKGSFENSDLLFWTGDKLGLVTFSPKPGSRAADFNEDDKTAAERAMKMEGDIYRARMRRIFQSARYFGENSDSDD